MRSSTLFPAASPGACDQSCPAVSNMIQVTQIRGKRFISGYDDSVARLQLYVLTGILSFDHLFVIERNSLLASIRILSQYIDGFLLGKITESARHGDGIQHGRRVGKRERARLIHVPQNVELLAVDLLNDDRDFRLFDE